jgi:hypothetical protein
MASGGATLTFSPFSFLPLVAALAFTMCSVAGPVEMQTIAKGAYGAESERRAVLVTADADYRQQWQALIGEGDIPAVDFEKNVVVFLLGGMRNTGGWSVVPNGVTVDAEGTAAIDAKVQGPPPGGITTQAVTVPYAVITIDNRDVAKVRWE